MRDHIRFYLGDTLYDLSGFSPTLTVLDWLREQRGRTGTKEGCNEGDCGACTVLVARLDGGPPDGPRLAWRAVNACIQFVSMLDGAQLFTVEDLRAPDGTLHPVQQAMVDLHGSQCGFCTPGFVMSMVAYRKQPGAVAEDGPIDDALAGNLCRCTGYAPIVRAMKQAMAAGSDRFDAQAAAIADRLSALRDGQTVNISGPAARLTIPADADALAATLLADPEATIVAGATDVGLWVTKGLRTLPHVVAIGQVPDLKRLDRTADGLRIGAAVTYEDARDALAGLLPDAGEIVRRIGSTQVRNAGTVCGNIANGSPIGDGPPVFIAAGATLHLRRGDVRRNMPLEDYFLAYGQQDRQPGEFVEGVTIPALRQGQVFRAYKVSKRFDQDISALLGAFALTLDDAGTITDARIAFGGMAATPRRARATEEALRGHPWSEATLQAARAAIATDFAPISDMRASDWYRRTVAANLLTRLFAETAPGARRPETRLAGRSEAAIHA
ncbi:xanthine dehydrogenase small subunit [Gluconacetobacter diazotrophicus]|uniref:Putative xanthine dehydrogenase, xdhA n=1 Tax=Gluconacetobacter diazotrophicus (strain ATCC 49037 / DSM 5601 / CCUG 37298 / CIP 103539 / LMG 7603 / PAl5) TaxID=272568 RepID=A9HJT1_GLUDA|nr:xanthine dehydrogenase small subunit [Gluconacetobacter diazotrophicus]CAP55946.1 putative xanthine dehydrogenase, xdhA [Gluconacetobacter diazotrophicus PA1 5]